MKENTYQKKESSGFTLMEVIVVLALFSTLAMGLLGMLLTVYRFTNSTEFTISYKTQEDRVRNFISNIIRQNQVTGAIEIYGEDGAQDHMRMKLADNSGNYAHFFAQDKILYMYVGNEPYKYTLTASEAENKAMPLARDMKSVRFDISEDSDTGNKLLSIKQVSEREVLDISTGGTKDKTVEFEYKINIYTG